MNGLCGAKMISARLARYLPEVENHFIQLESIENIIKNSSTLGLREVAIPYLKRTYYDNLKPQLEESGYRINEVYNDGNYVMFYVRW